MMGKPSIQEPPSPGPDVFGALGDAVDALSSQRALLAAAGVGLGPSEAETHLARLAPSLPAGRDAHDQNALTALCIALGEIKRRQQLIRDLPEDADSFEAIALDTFSSAMHRVRTSLDVAIGLLEEIGETCTGENRADILAGAAEAAKSLRLVYHYSHELNEMAAIRDHLDQLEASEFTCSSVIAGAIQDLSRVADDCGVAINVQISPQDVHCVSDAMAVRRIIRQLLLLAIVSPGVTSVTCAAKEFVHSGGSLTTINITDNGRGLSLADRAAVTQLGLPPGARQTADLAGFAVARRMAKALGGRLMLEYLRGRGSRSQLSFPSRLNLDAAGQRKSGPHDPQNLISF